MQRGGSWLVRKGGAAGTRGKQGWWGLCARYHPDQELDQGHAHGCGIRGHEGRGGKETPAVTRGGGAA